MWGQRLAHKLMGGIHFNLWKKPPKFRLAKSQGSLLAEYRKRREARKIGWIRRLFDAVLHRKNSE